MSQTYNSARRQIVGPPIEWVRRFDPKDYVNNRPMIAKLNEDLQWALTSSLELADRVKELEERNHDLEKTHVRLDEQLKDTSRKSLSAFVLSSLSSVLLGIGVNVSTASPASFTGWVLIASAIVVALSAFLLLPRNTK